MADFSTIFWNTLFIFVRQYIFIIFAFGQKCQEVSIIHNSLFTLAVMSFNKQKKYNILSILRLCLEYYVRAYCVRIKWRRMQSFCNFYQRNSWLRWLISLLKTFVFFCLVIFKYMASYLFFPRFYKLYVKRKSNPILYFFVWPLGAILKQLIQLAGGQQK